jgi:hypothetical protein
MCDNALITTFMRPNQNPLNSMSRNSSTPKSLNSSRSEGERVGPPLKLDVKCPQNRDTLNRCWYSRRIAGREAKIDNRACSPCSSECHSNSSPLALASYSHIDPIHAETPPRHGCPSILTCVGSMPSSEVIVDGSKVLPLIRNETE